VIILVQLVDVCGVFKREHTQTHSRHSFYVAHSLSNLHISFQYTPKILADEELSRSIIKENLPSYLSVKATAEEDWRKFLPLTNLLTLSLDDPLQFRGAAHRPPAQQEIELEAKTASPGFLPGDLPVGVWQVTVSAHAVVTEECSYQLLVYGVYENER